MLNLAGSAGGQKNFEFELSGIRGAGLGELGSRIGRAGWGGSFYGGWLLPGTPFSFGVRLAIVNYGSEHNVDLAGYSAAAPGGVKYGYNILLTHFVLRVQPRESLLMPYLEALAGINYFFTQAYGGGGSSVPFMIGDAVLVMNQNDATTLVSSVAPSVGLGGGLKYRLAEFNSGGKGTGARLGLFLDVQGRYLLGGTAKYLRPGSMALDGDRLIYDILIISFAISHRGTKPPHVGPGKIPLKANLIIEVQPEGGCRRQCRAYVYEKMSLSRQHFEDSRRA